jgi:hypothetical protein
VVYPELRRQPLDGRLGKERKRLSEQTVTIRSLCQVKQDVAIWDRQSDIHDQWPAEFCEARSCEEIQSQKGLSFPEAGHYKFPVHIEGGYMRQISAWPLLGAAIGFMAWGIAQAAPPMQAQNESVEPFRIIGNIYWVGGEYGSYLITTPQGHILHDTGTSEMHDVIVSNVKKLGFDVKDIKIMISSHAHFDHVQGHGAMKQVTGAQVVALGGDAAALEAGQDNSAGGFRGMLPVHVDRVIKDGDTVTLDGVTLRAFWTPGHTQGATVWMTTVEESGKTYSVAFRGGGTPDAGVPLVESARLGRVVGVTLMRVLRR